MRIITRLDVYQVRNHEVPEGLTKFQLSNIQNALVTDPSQSDEDIALSLTN